MNIHNNKIIFVKKSLDILDLFCYNEDGGRGPLIYKKGVNIEINIKLTTLKTLMTMFIIPPFQITNRIITFTVITKLKTMPL